MLTQEHLDKVAAFHGHICPGMLIGFKAVEGAIAQLGLSDKSLPQSTKKSLPSSMRKGPSLDYLQARPLHQAALFQHHRAANGDRQAK